MVATVFEHVRFRTPLTTCYFEFFRIFRPSALQTPEDPLSFYDAFLDHLVCAGTNLVLGSSGIQLEIIAGQIVWRKRCISG
jgi:hypothetical protein